MKRNDGIDALRLIAAISIISLHLGPGLELPTELAGPAAVAARFAVPVFFIISGFFLHRRLLSHPQLIFETLYKLSKIIVLSSLIYVPLVALRDGIDALGWILTSFYLLAAGTSFHLWFLSSLFFGILVLAFVFRAGRQKYLGFISVPIGLAWILANHFRVVSEEQLGFLRYISGIPLLHCGLALAGWLGKNPPNRLTWSIVLILGGGFGQFVEAWASQRFLGNDPVQLQLLFSTVAFSVGLVLFSQNFTSSHWEYIGKLGRDYSLGIYVIHVWVISIFRNVYDFAGISGKTWSTLALTPLVFATSLILLVIGKCARDRWVNSRMKLAPLDR